MDNNDLNENLPAKSTMDHDRFTKRMHLDDGRVFQWVNESQQWQDVNTGVLISEVEMQNLQFSIVEAEAAAQSQAASAASSDDTGAAGPRVLNPNLLVNGTGFLTDGTGDSVDLGFVGTSSMQGYTAAPIVAWSQMPYLTYEDDFYVTLQAHHINDIEKVEFSLNGGATATVNRKGCPVSHPKWGTRHEEYYAKVPVTTMSNGNNEIRAVVYPKGAGKIVRLEGRTEAFYTDGEGVVQLGATFDHTGKTGNGNIAFSRHITPNNIQQELLSGGAGYKGHNPQGPGIAAEGFYFNINSARNKWYVDPGFAGTEEGTESAPYRTLQAVFENEWDTAAKCKLNADMAVYLKTPSGSGVSGAIHQWPRANFGTLNSVDASNTDRSVWSNAATGGHPVALAHEKVVDIIGLPTDPTATDGTQYVHMRGFSGGNPESFTDGAGVIMGFSGGSPTNDLNIRFKGLWIKPDFQMSGNNKVFHANNRVSLTKLFIDDCYFSRGNTYHDSSQGIQQKAFPLQTTSAGADWPGGIYCFDNTTWGTAYIAKGVKVAKHNEHIRMKGDMYPTSPGALIANMWHIHGGASHSLEVHSDLWQFSNPFHMRNRIIAGNKVANCNGQLGHMSFGKATRYRDNSAGIDFDTSRRHSYGSCYPNENFAHVDNEYDCPQASHNMNIGGVVDHFVIDRNNLRNASYSFSIPNQYVGGNARRPKTQGVEGGGTMGSTGFGQSGGHSGPHLYKNFRFTNNLQGKFVATRPDYDIFNTEHGEWGTGEVLTLFSGTRSITWGSIFDHTSSKCENNHIMNERSQYPVFFADKDTTTTFGEVTFKRCRPDFNWCGSEVDALDPHDKSRPIGCPTDIRDVAGAPGHATDCPSYYMPTVYTGSAITFRDTDLAFFAPLMGGTAYRNMETTHDFFTAYPPNGPFGVFDLTNDKTHVVDNPTLKAQIILDDHVGVTHYYDPENVFGFTSGGNMSGGSASGDTNRVGSGQEPYDFLGVSYTAASGEHGGIGNTGASGNVGFVTYTEGIPGINLDPAIITELGKTETDLPIGRSKQTNPEDPSIVADTFDTLKTRLDTADFTTQNTGNTKIQGDPPSLSGG